MRTSVRLSPRSERLRVYGNRKADQLAKCDRFVFPVSKEVIKEVCAERLKKGRFRSVGILLWRWLVGSGDRNDVTSACAIGHENGFEM